MYVCMCIDYKHLKTVTSEEVIWFMGGSVQLGKTILVWLDAKYLLPKASVNKQTPKLIRLELGEKQKQHRFLRSVI